MSRVEVHLPAIGNEPFRMLADGVRGGKKRSIGTLSDPVGIHPGVELHAAFVRLLDHEGDRIPERFGSLSLYAGKVDAPGFDRAGIKRVARRTHLHDDRIGIDSCQRIEVGDKSFLEFFLGQALFGRPVDVGHRGHPACTHFILGRFVLRTGGNGCAQSDSRQNRSENFHRL